MVTTDLLKTDLGLTLDGDGEASPSFYGEPGVTDCGWFDGKVTVTVHATTDADRDLPDSTVQGYLQSGGAAVAGADRGVASLTTDVAGTNLALIVVQGGLGLEVSVATDGSITQAQSQQLGGDLAHGLSDPRD